MPNPSTERRLAVAVDLTEGPQRAHMLRHLEAVGIRPVAVEPAETCGYPVVVTSHAPALDASRGVVIHLPDDGQPYAARLVSGQWLHLDSLAEAADFAYEVIVGDRAGHDG